MKRSPFPLPVDHAPPRSFKLTVMTAILAALALFLSGFLAGGLLCSAVIVSHTDSELRKQNYVFTR